MPLLYLHSLKCRILFILFTLLRRKRIYVVFFIYLVKTHLVLFFPPCQSDWRPSVSHPSLPPTGLHIKCATSASHKPASGFPCVLSGSFTDSISAERCISALRKEEPFTQPPVGVRLQPYPPLLIFFFFVFIYLLKYHDAQRWDKASSLEGNNMWSNAKSMWLVLSASTRVISSCECVSRSNDKTDQH